MATPPPSPGVSADRPFDRAGPAARTVRWLLFAAALAVNLATMYVPSVPGPGLDLPLGLRADLLGHAATFAALTFTGLLAGIRPPLLLTLVAVNAVSSELVQHLLLPDRTGDVTDLAADAVGIALGLLAHRAWTSLRERRRARRAGGA